MKNLLDSYTMKNLNLKNRIVMSPMTRARTSQPGDIPNSMMAKYYEQRASAGLIIAEATQISIQGKGYSFTPGIYTEAQIEGWKQVTEAVHNKSGKIFLQLWHVGRMSHQSLHPDKRTVAPSAIKPNAKVWIADGFGNGNMVECPVPEELTKAEINDIILDYKKAAKNAKVAGFDGIEIHAGNGYLLDEFLRSTSNKRTDEYGGSVSNRLRIFNEILDGVSNEFDSERIGLRLSPHNTSRGMECEEVVDAVYELMSVLEEKRIGYVHFAEADWDEAPLVPSEFRSKIRSLYSGTVIVAGNYDKEKGNKIVKDGYADLVGYGRPFISNPDLVERIEKDLPLSDYDDTSFFGGNDKGYTDYKGFNELK